MFPSYLSRLNKSSSSIAFSICFQGCFSTLRTVLLWSALSSFLKPWWPKVGVRLPLSFEHFVCRNRSFTGNKPNLHTDTWVGLCHLASVLGPVSGQVLEIIGFCCSPHLISERQTPNWLNYQEDAATHLSCKSLLPLCLFSLPQILGQLL